MGVGLAALAFWVAVLVGAVVVVGIVAVADRENSGSEYMWNVDVME